MATLTEVTQLMMTLAAKYPNAPTLTKANYRAYHEALGDLTIELLTAGARHAGATSRFFPAASELRRAAMALIERAEGVPNAQDAWAEVCRSFGTNGRYWGAPEWSTPLIEMAVAAIGGYAALCVSENPVADRARFMQAYDVYLDRHRADRAMLPSVRRAVARLGAGTRGALGEGERENGKR